MFTSPFDNQIDIAAYKERCWSGADSIGKYEFLSLIEDGDEVFARWRCPIGSKVIQNTEYFLLEEGKIRAVEVYFGQPTGSGGSGG